MSFPWTPSDRRAAGRRAIAILTAVCVVWGSTFFLIKLSMRAIAGSLQVAPEDPAVWTSLLATRFVLAVPVLALMSPKAFRHLGSRALWRDAGWIALPTALGFALQAAGLAYVSPGTSAFLTSLYMPFTPVAAWLLFRKRLSRSLLSALLVGLVGLWILTPPTAPSFGVGELLSAACGVIFAFQIVAIDRVASRHDSGGMTIAMFLLLAAVFSIAGAIFSRGPGIVSGPALAYLSRSPERWFPLLFISTVATAFPLWGMNHFQKHLDPSHAATVYAAEPVFAAIFSAVFFGERFGPLALLGGALIVAANVWAGRAASVSVPPELLPASPDAG